MADETMPQPLDAKELERVSFAYYMHDRVPSDEDMRRLLATARAGLADSTRMGWLEKHCRKAAKAIPGFHQATLSDGVKVYERDTLRECIDAASGVDVPFNRRNNSNG